jgi:WASH complex subunit 4, N-terminal
MGVSLVQGETKERKKRGARKESWARNEGGWFYFSLFPPSIFCLPALSFSFFEREFASPFSVVLRFHSFSPLLLGRPLPRSRSKMAGFVDDEEYTFDDFNDGSERQAAEHRQRALLGFARRFAAQVRAVEEALDDTLIGTGSSQEMVALLQQNPEEFLSGDVDDSVPLSIRVPQESVAAWDMAQDPLRVDLEMHEQASAIDMIRTDNVPFDKVIRCFAADVSEVDALVMASDPSRTRPVEPGPDAVEGTAATDAPNVFWALQLFSEVPFGEDQADTFEEGVAQIAFGRLLPVLLQAGRFVDRVSLVCKNIVQQLASLFSPQSQLYNASFKGVHFQSVFERLGDAFRLLMMMDSVFASSDAYAQCLAMYKRMAKNIREDPGRYGVTATEGGEEEIGLQEEDRLYALERQLFELKGKLLDGRIFASCLEQDFEEGGAIFVHGNAVFKDEFALALRSLLDLLAATIGDSTETTHKRKLMGLYGLYVCFVGMFKDPSDKKLLQALYDMHIRVVCVPLMADVVWWPSVFLSQHIPTVVKMVKIGKNQSPQVVARSHLQRLDSQLGSHVKMLYLQTAMWSVRMESTTPLNAAVDTGWCFSRLCFCAFSSSLFPNELLSLRWNVLGP